jgi:hypothetical protein
MSGLALRKYDQPQWSGAPEIGVRFSRSRAEKISWPRPLTSTASTTGGENWIDLTLARMEELTQLDDNWDGRGSAGIRADVLSFALSVLAQVMPHSASAPAIVPLGHGGVQLLWHNRDNDLEVEIADPNQLEIYLLDKNTGAEHEFPLTTELSPLTKILWSKFRS